MDCDEEWKVMNILQLFFWSDKLSELKANRDILFYYEFDGIYFAECMYNPECKKCSMKIVIGWLNSN